jgi:uncharacterized protein (DUF1810 family)
MADPFDLARFVEAQDARRGGLSVYEQALAELRSGAKQSHWMWFVFPQLQGLGASAMAQTYAITGLPEARAYLAHPVLGPRYRACVTAINGVEGRTARQLMGRPDDLKLRSSLTLFARATDDGADFRAALAKYYGGEEDPETARRLPAA